MGVTLLLTVLLHIFSAASSLGASELRFTIVHTSDEHSSLMPAPMADYVPGQTCPAMGGFARLSTLVERIRQQKNGLAEPLLLLSSGDFIGGTPFSWLIQKELAPELDLMRRLGYVATTFGNHEFDYGPEKFVEYFKRGNPEPGAIVLLSANIVIPEDHVFNQLPIKEHLLLTLANGLKIGIFGLLGKGAHRLAPAARPLDFADQQDSARRAVAALKLAGAEVIIALTHAGINEDRELAQAVSGIDLILGGHDHIRTDPPEQVKNTLIMHSGYFLRSAGQLDLAFNRVTGGLRIRNNETSSPIIHELNSNIAEDPQLIRLVDDYRLKLNDFLASFTAGDFSDMGQIIARSEFALIKHQSVSETTVGNFITDAIRFETARITGDQVHFAFHANGIIRGNIIPGTLDATRGNITFFDLATLSGLGSGKDGEPGYPLVSFYLNETEVLNMLEIATLLPLLWGDVYFLQVSGLRYSYDPQRAFWFKVPIINKPLPAYCSIRHAERYLGDGLQSEPDYAVLSAWNTKLYHIATTHYLASYLPMVGKKLPRLNLVLKNKQGQPVELDDCLIKLNNREFKLWEAAARYARSFASDSRQIAVIPEYYRQTGGRITIVAGTPLWVGPLIALSAILLLVFAFRLSKKRKSPAIH